jgi:hypothetical protein
MRAGATANTLLEIHPRAKETAVAACPHARHVPRVALARRRGKRTADRFSTALRAARHLGKKFWGEEKNFVDDERQNRQHRFRVYRSVPGSPLPDSSSHVLRR